MISAPVLHVNGDYPEVIKLILIKRTKIIKIKFFDRWCQ